MKLHMSYNRTLFVVIQMFANIRQKSTSTNTQDTNPLLAKWQDKLG